MSNTFRKDINDNIFKESLKKKSFKARYKCQCQYCVGVDRNELVDKIAEKELKTELKEIIEQGVDFDIPEQDEILEQIMGRS